MRRATFNLTSWLSERLACISPPYRSKLVVILYGLAFVLLIAGGVVATMFISYSVGRAIWSCPGSYSVITCKVTFLCVGLFIVTVGISLLAITAFALHMIHDCITCLSDDARVIEADMYNEEAVAQGYSNPTEHDVEYGVDVGNMACN